MMLSMFHLHQQQDHGENNQRQDGSPLSTTDLASTGSSVGGHSEDCARTNSTASPPLSSSSAGDGELLGGGSVQPQDLTVKKRQDCGRKPSPVINGASQIESVVNALRARNGGGTSLNRSNESIQSSTSIINGNRNHSNGASSVSPIESDQQQIGGGEQSTSYQCPLCADSRLLNETEFLEHFLRWHNGNGENGAAGLLINNRSGREENGQSIGEDKEVTTGTVYCDLCRKEFCNEWFLKSHKAKAHGIIIDESNGGQRSSPNDHHPQSSNNNGNNGHHRHRSSNEQTPKTSPISSIFDPPTSTTSATNLLTNPMMAAGGLPFGAMMDHQQQLAAALGQHQQQQSVCPFCHQFFPNQMVLQNHLLTSHSGLLMNPTAAMYAATMMQQSTTNPFGAAGGAFFQPPPPPQPQPQQSNGKNNLQQQYQQHQQQQQQMAALAAMLGIGGGGGATDPMTAAAMAAAAASGASANPLDYFAQTPTVLMPGANFGGGMNGKSHQQQLPPPPYYGLMGTGGGMMDEEKPSTTSASSTTGMAFPSMVPHQTPTKNLEAYCEICQKEFCNKYFLRTHKLNKHGILDESPKNGRANAENVNSNKSPTSSSPTPRSTTNGGGIDLKRDAAMFTDLLRDEIDGQSTAKMPKLSEMNGGETTSSMAPSTSSTNQQYACNLCVKAFPSMFALVAHKYRDHGTFDGASAAASTLPSISPAGGLPSSSQQQHRSSISSSRKSIDGESSTMGSPMKGIVLPPPQSGQTTVDLEAYCEICQKEFCSKYFLRVHKANIHGIGSITPNSSPSMVSTTMNGFGASTTPIHVPLGVRRSLNGTSSMTDDSPGPMNLSMGGGGKYEENGRRGSLTNGSINTTAASAGLMPTSAAAILMMAAAGNHNGNGLPSMVAGQYNGRQLVASKNFCDICNKELCNKYFLRTHMLKMHGIVIDENKTVIANINTLDKEKSGELLFRCDLCGEQSASRQQLRAHKQTVHQVIVPAAALTPTASMSSTAINHDNGASPTTTAMQNRSSSSTSTVKRESSSIDELIESLASGRNLSTSSNDDDQRAAISPTNQAAMTPTTMFNGGDTRDVSCTMCGEKFQNGRFLRMHMFTDHNQHQKIKKTVSVSMPMSLTCEYCSTDFPDHTELQLHVINEHQHEVRGSLTTMAEQAALDALSNSSAFVAAVNSVANAVAEAAAAAGSGNGRGTPTMIDGKMESTTSTASTPSDSMTMMMENNESETKTRTPTVQHRQQQQSHSELPLVTRNTNGTKLFRCSYCNYYTKWISNLSTHEKRHNVNRPSDGDGGEKPFKCRMCLRSYRYSHSLQRHMEVHRAAAIGLRTATAGVNLAALSTPPYNNLRHQSTTPPALSTPNGMANGHDQSADTSIPPPPVLGSPHTENGPTTTIAQSPDKRYHCQFCSKAFGNRELYRMHAATMHNTTVLPAAEASSSPSPKRALHRCRQCHFVTSKSFDDLRMHILQKHTISSMSPAKLSMAINNGNQNGGHRELNGDDQRSNGGVLNLSSKFDELEANGNGKISPKANTNCAIQAFVMSETGGGANSVFPPSSVVYLPVLRRVESPIETSFTLTPIESEKKINGDI